MCQFLEASLSARRLRGSGARNVAANRASWRTLEPGRRKLAKAALAVKVNGEMKELGDRLAEAIPDNAAVHVAGETTFWMISMNLLLR